LENACNILVRKLEKKRSHGRLGHIWQENITTYSKKEGVKVLTGFN
jgi:hypothetical protein